MRKRNSYPWGRIVADAKGRDGWFLPPELIAVPTRVAQGVRLLRHPDLLQDDGRLEARLVDPWVDEEGHRLGNIYVRYVYADKQPPTGAGTEPNGGTDE